MGNLVHFKRKLDSLVLEEVKQQAKQSWLSSQTMPTEVVDALLAEVERLQAELTQARDELATVDEALDVEKSAHRGSVLIADDVVNEMRQALDIALQAAQDQSDEVQELWLSPAEAEGLKRQLARAQIQAAAPKKATEWLWGFWDGNTLVAKPGYEDDIHEAWDALLMAVDSIAGDALLERLVEAERAVCDHEEANDHIRQVLSKGFYTLGVKEDGVPFFAHNPAKELTERLAKAEQRAEHAEALAALVTPELAGLLERLTTFATHARIGDNYDYQHWHSGQYNNDIDTARALVTRIREAL